MSAEDLTAANQRVLVAEFSRIKSLLAGERTSAVECELAAARDALGEPAAVDVICNAFGLSPFERDVLLLCAGVELDAEIAAVCATISTLAAQPHATFAMALAKFVDPHWSALAPIRPLRAFRLIQVRDERSITTSPLDIDERILHFLTGMNYLDTRLHALVREHVAIEPLADSHELVVEKTLAALKKADDRPFVQLVGNDLQSACEIARRAAARLGLGLHLLHASDIPTSPHEVEAFALLWNRDSKLLQSALLIQVELADEAAAAHFLNFVSYPVFVTSERPIGGPSAAILHVQRLASAEQKKLWTELLGDRARTLNGPLDAVIAQFCLGSSAIARTARVLRASPATHDQLAKALWKACRETSRTRLDNLALRVESAARWRDLVLPDQQISTLRQIAAHARQRLKVYEEWGFSEKGPRGLGISVLFSGESGTGKTMAAEVLANELDLDLFRIDLATVVSKYIGETEKNLRRIFEAAEVAGAILLFDEADALFGRRGEVKDSQDRFANIEVSYLLQRMESYRGLAILTTNLKDSIDRAFLRRLRFIVQFPFPDQQMRERIWRGAFPAAMPADLINYRRLAQLNVAGGNIRNIALNAAFLAADSDVPIGMVHLLQAARSEAAKGDRPFSDAETKGWT